ncbi:hypothetical protein G4B88_023183 [Cannabis sativa]|uniref:Uncharacterized protein n=1 Tax=Cannabis sativa TaxID=3483 RepID=A0A7J6EGZ7_CANSA|nr:hypothetical protein G4B88_023183 [Cannabis sativa]
MNAVWPVLKQIWHFGVLVEDGGQLDSKCLVIEEGKEMSYGVDETMVKQVGEMAVFEVSIVEEMVVVEEMTLEGKFGGKEREVAAVEKCRGEEEVGWAAVMPLKQSSTLHYRTTETPEIALVGNPWVPARDPTTLSSVINFVTPSMSMVPVALATDDVVAIMNTAIRKTPIDLAIITI